MMTRRHFTPLLAAPLLAQASGGITDIEGIRVGHFTDKRRPTGCTVLLFDQGATAAVDVRGSAPGTRETDLLDPVNTVDKINALVLSGGSAFGLDAATGVVRYLEEKGIGWPTPSGPVPIVPAAILMDLGIGDAKIRPNAESGYQAALNAKSGPVAEGSVGAGAGATVGKFFGADRAMKGGLGTASLRPGPNGLIVAALVVVNAVGDVVDPSSGRIVAGARTANGKAFANTAKALREGYRLSPAPAQNTTIGLVATNAVLNKVQLKKIAQMAHDGLARTINPIHTPADGDTIFAVATGTNKTVANHGIVGALAAEVLADAVLRAVRLAKGLPGIPAVADWKP